MTSQLQPAPISRGEPLREAVYARVVELICSGQYAPGSALTEASLSKHLDVSRTPVREALLRLAAEGVLTSTLARGFVVRPLAISEARNLYPILWTLEGLAVSELGKGAKALSRDLKSIQSELETTTEPVRRWQLDTAWHEAVVSITSNEHLRSMVGQLRTNLGRYEMTYMREMEVREAADSQHHQIQRAIESADGKLAAELLAAHWRDGMSSVVGWLESS